MDAYGLRIVTVGDVAGGNLPSGPGAPLVHEHFAVTVLFGKIVRAFASGGSNREELGETSLTVLYPTMFHLPENADEPFRRLIRDHDLPFVNSVDESPSTTDEENIPESGGEGEGRGGSSKVGSEGEPRPTWTMSLRCADR